MEKVDLFEKYSARLEDMMYPGCDPLDIAIYNYTQGHELNERDKQELEKLRGLPFDEAKKRISSSPGAIVSALLGVKERGDKDDVR